MLLAPGDEEGSAGIDARDVRSTIDALGRAADVVLLHLPRGLDEVTRAAIDRLAARLLEEDA